MLETVYTILKLAGIVAGYEFLKWGISFIDW